jgi:hypothetical protein
LHFAPLVGDNTTITLESSHTRFFEDFTMNTSRRFAWLIALAVFAGCVQAIWASPYCCDGKSDLPLVQQFDEAQIVLFGHFRNPKLVQGGGGLDQGTTELVIEHVYKDHPMVQGKKVITLPRYITNDKIKFIVFCDVYKGKIDAYKGTELADDGEMRKYLEGVMKLKGKPQPERLRFAFDYLTSPENTVAMDAYWEFARADYRDYKDIARKLNPDQIVGWLKDPKTPTYRYGLYATLLGHCGNGKHADFLMTMINDPERRKGSGLHGLMMGYTLMEPDKGWKFLKTLVTDKEQVFLTRYSGLLTMRFLYEARPEIVHKDEAVARKEVIGGILGILHVSDMADFAIEDLRKWKRWETCDQVLGQFGQKEFNTPIIRKAILRYALQCPNDAAKKFCEVQRNRDRDWYDDTKELLELETLPPSVK